MGERCSSDESSTPVSQSGAVHAPLRTGSPRHRSLPRAARMRACSFSWIKSSSARSTVSRFVRVPASFIARAISASSISRLVRIGSVPSLSLERQCFDDHSLQFRNRHRLQHDSFIWQKRRRLPSRASNRSACTVGSTSGTRSRLSPTRTSRAARSIARFDDGGGSCRAARTKSS
jgi:hypothetical protein